MTSFYYASASQMVKLDKLAYDSGLEISQMMELAGWHILALFESLKIKLSKRVVVLVGKGNKGGDGLCAARHLINNGWKTKVVLISSRLSPDSKHQLDLLQRMKAPILVYKNKIKSVESIIRESGVVIDALIGYRLSGSPRGDYGNIINYLNNIDKKPIAYDIPTGVDSTTGECYEPFVRACATLTLALPKKAFKQKKTMKFLGRIFLADVGIPASLYDKVAKGSRPRFERFKNPLIEL